MHSTDSVAVYYSQWHNMYEISNIKNLATCFGYKEPSSGQLQNEVLVLSMIVHSTMYQNFILSLA